jgi:hypothetical protein
VLRRRALVTRVAQLDTVDAQSVRRSQDGNIPNRVGPDDAKPDRIRHPAAEHLCPRAMHIASSAQERYKRLLSRNYKVKIFKNKCLLIWNSLWQHGISF